MTASQHSHPNPKLYRLTQWLALILTLIIFLSAPLQIVIAIIYPQAVLFYLSALITLTLAVPLIHYLITTPTVALDKQGVTIYPFIGKVIYIDWSAIHAVKLYPLLPKRGNEVNKRLLVGRKRYKPAEGVMLISTELPMIYRVGGFFAGENGQKIIALTNRTHTDYDRLIKKILKFVDKEVYLSEDNPAYLN